MPPSHLHYYTNIWSVDKYLTATLHLFEHFNMALNYHLYINDIPSNKLNTAFIHTQPRMYAQTDRQFYKSLKFISLLVNK